MSALHTKLFRDLWRMRGQVFTVALVVASGIATYVTMRGCYEAIERAQGEYYRQYRFADVFVQLKRAPESLAAAIAAIPGVSSIQTRVVVDVNLDVPGLEEPAVGRIVSVPEGAAPSLNNLYIRSGRYLQRGDEVLISEAFAAANKLEPGSTVGAVINGRWEPLHVVGVALSPEYVYEIRGGAVFPDSKRFGVFWMSRDALGPAFSMEGAFNDAALSLAPDAREPEVIARLDSLLEPYGGLGAYGRYDQISNRFLSDETMQDRVTGILVPSIFLGVAAFLLHVVLSRLVLTQRGSIGLLKAFGYTRFRIGLHYLEFAMVAVMLGTFLGTAAGIWLGRGLASIYRDFFRFPELAFAATPGLLISAIGISGGAACVGALSALRSVIALPPAESMRPAAPASFEPGLAERLGVSRFVSLSGRIILRNLSRHPWKAAVSTLAMALAGSILVVGLYFNDAIDYIIRVEFQAASREDFSVTLTEPLGANARYALERLPGVLRTEAFRAVPARLRFESRSRRVAILGLEENPDLRRLVDLHLQAVDLPRDGIVLSANLARTLTVSPGNKITVEVLEGSRPVRSVTVAATVDDLIGSSAYMDVRALNRMMGEGRTISGAYLAVDPADAAHLDAVLKRTPAVGAVGVRQSMLDSFRQTIARSMTISTGSLVVFACVIAFGVVYNGARIALSERMYDLASLRILGFTKAEITWMLLGEQALLAGVSVPFGFLLGYGICFALVHAMQSDLYRMPLVVTGQTYAWSFLILLAASAISGSLIAFRLRRLDLVSVLKARE